jgi:mxaK protein
MRRRTVHTSFAIIAGVCAAIAIWLGARLREAERINTAIATSQVPTADSTVPQAQLAQALVLARSGKFTAALKAYKSLLESSDEVRLPALYDLGNLNMREALKNGQGEVQRSLPLIELAKQSYRDELRSNPDDWDARYNLERALWLSPEYDDPLLQRHQAPAKAEHAMSTLQGAKIDLP